jgi:hypothetical protein
MWGKEGGAKGRGSKGSGGREGKGRERARFLGMERVGGEGVTTETKALLPG